MKRSSGAVEACGVGVGYLRGDIEEARAKPDHIHSSAVSAQRLYTR